MLTGGKVTVWLVVVQTQNSAFLLEFMCRKVKSCDTYYYICIMTCNLISFFPKPVYSDVVFSCLFTLSSSSIFWCKLQYLLKLKGKNEEFYKSSLRSTRIGRVYGDKALYVLYQFWLKFWRLVFWTFLLWLEWYVRFISGKIGSSWLFKNGFFHWVILFSIFKSLKAYPTILEAYFRCCLLGLHPCTF